MYLPESHVAYMRVILKFFLFVVLGVLDHCLTWKGFYRITCYTGINRRFPYTA